MILGTAAYMSPEQARGKPVDKRSDVWAFGAVLYEMLTGKRAFVGEDVSDTLAAVLRGEPDWARLPPNLPAPVRALLQGCLERDRRRRIGDVAAALFVVNNTGSLSATAGGPALHGDTRVRPRWTPALLLATAASLIGVGIGAGLWRQPAAASPPTSRFSLRLPDGQIFTSRAPRMVSVSRDGSQLVYLASSRLFRRPVGALQATVIAGSLQWDSRDVVFAPDGQSIAFYSVAEGAVMRVPLSGGTPTMIGRAEPPLGMSWGADGIVVGQGRGGVLRFRVSGVSAPAEQIVKVEDDEIAASPQILPGGDAVLFTLATRAADAGEQWDKARVIIQSLPTGERHTIVEGGSDGRYLPTGHVVYAVAGTVVAARLDLGARRVTSEPVTVVEGVRRSFETGVAQMAMSDSGTLFYVPGATTWTNDDLRTFAVTDTAGATLALPLPAGVYYHPRVSADGKRMAFSRSDQQDTDIWIHGFDGATAVRRLTFEGHNRFPVWSPDGSRIAFQSDREGDLGIFVQDAEGAAAPERLTKPDADEAHAPESWSPDGKHLLFSVRRGSRFTLWSVNVDDRKSAPFGGVASVDGPPGAVFSPDGRWVAYTINEAVAAATSPNRGVFVQPFPATGARYQVPRSALDYHPAWARDGKTLFYLRSALTSIAAVPVRTDSGISFGSPMNIAPTSRVLYGEARGYDVLPDGRFVSVVPAPSDAAGAASATPELRVVLNWHEELKRLAPAK